MTDHFNPPDLRLTAGVARRGGIYRPCLRIEQGDQTATITCDIEEVVPLLRAISRAIFDAAHAAIDARAEDDKDGQP
ncbi:hypothetical protein [uncultured Arsenicicoccus sp.]|uniref:hypothetical protein n=1 Tax=uncultured Arsenicicoccus sp. TaxID=491339 RepID=UPI0025975773|nr:hypothetical protein [uncultured Arsenicicoccus sp.]